jgi:hypothetical protein
MATQPNHPSEVTQDYASIDLGEPFEFENRLNSDKDDPLYDRERMELNDPDDAE